MKNVLQSAIDWTSIKLNVVCSIGFLLDNAVLQVLAALATLSTLIYNSLKIYSFFKNKKK
jgi:hypothetical protein